MKTIQPLPEKLTSLYPPIITTTLSGTYCIVDGKWIAIDPKTTLEEVRDRWIRVSLLGDKEPVKLVEKIQEFDVKSSDGKKTYIVTAKGSVVTCTCTGFGYRSKCRHVDDIKKKLDKKVLKKAA